MVCMFGGTHQESRKTTISSNNQVLHLSATKYEKYSLSTREKRLAQTISVHRVGRVAAADLLYWLVVSDGVNSFLHATRILQVHEVVIHFVSLCTFCCLDGPG